MIGPKKKFKFGHQKPKKHSIVAFCQKIALDAKFCTKK
jgi:hypothetical protein